jgi:dipeptidase E
MVADHLSSDKLYIGSSAGSVVMGPSIGPIKVFDEPSEAPQLVNFDGLGHVAYVVLPHYGNSVDLPLFDGIERDYGDRMVFVRLRDDQAIFATSRAGLEVVESALSFADL